MATSFIACVPREMEGRWKWREMVDISADISGVVENAPDLESKGLDKSPSFE